MGDLGEIGWYLRIDYLSEQSLKRQPDSIPLSPIPISPYKRELKPTYSRDKMKQPLFQFRFDNDTGRFVRELRENIFVDNATKDPNFVNGYYTGNYLDFGNDGGSTSPASKS